MHRQSSSIGCRFSFDATNCNTYSKPNIRSDATGEGGVAARWGGYLNSKHGGNKKLRELYEREGEEYFQRYFEFTLLEYFGMSYDPLKVLEREQWWKNCLDTRVHGYNDN